MIRRLGYDCFAAYTGGDMWGGRMLGLCDSRSEAQSLVDEALGRLAEVGNARTSLNGLNGEILAAAPGAPGRSVSPLRRPDDLTPMNEIGAHMNDGRTSESDARVTGESRSVPDEARGERDELLLTLCMYEAEVARLNRMIDGLALVNATSNRVIEAAGRVVDHWSRRVDRSVAYAEAGERAKNMLIHAVRNCREAAARLGGESS